VTNTALRVRNPGVATLSRIIRRVSAEGRAACSASLQASVALGLLPDDQTIFGAEASPGAKVTLRILVQAHHAVDAALLLEADDGRIRAKASIGQQDISLLQLRPELAKKGALMGCLFPLTVSSNAPLASEKSPTSFGLADEQPVFLVHRIGADRIFHQIVVQIQATVFSVHRCRSVAEAEPSENERVWRELAQMGAICPDWERKWLRR